MISLPGDKASSNMKGKFGQGVMTEVKSSRMVRGDAKGQGALVGTNLNNNANEFGVVELASLRGLKVVLKYAIGHELGDNEDSAIDASQQKPRKCMMR
ncbi:hypothetical protein EGR_10168 [Echinococcus granulosus]|uniref:Uncharacterized protein n=1 Tax=Echinococcus granulosus TaxID=6210 RepID=W6U1K6_ECHGR|nr:hypothetical protein EGR_10168 [Echinococcus granulosus]EUB54960.1 hypothetical protein EGR_10168 [Echinococcus granulosus]